VNCYFHGFNGDFGIMGKAISLYKQLQNLNEFSVFFQIPGEKVLDIPKT
jgi:hypothetical protein